MGGGKGLGEVINGMLGFEGEGGEEEEGWVGRREGFWEGGEFEDWSRERGGREHLRKREGLLKENKITRAAGTTQPNQNQIMLLFFY